MRLGIDLDGVISDFHTGWMNRYNDEFQTDLTSAQVIDWDPFTKLTHFTTTDEFWSWAENSMGFGVFRNLPFIPGAESALHRLADHHDIVIITTKPVWAVPETFSWIGERSIPTREVHVVDEKWHVDCDIYLDDAVHNLERLFNERPNRLVCRFLQRWNHPVPGVEDVDGWGEFEELVSSHSRG